MEYEKYHLKHKWNHISHESDWGKKLSDNIKSWQRYRKVATLSQLERMEIDIKTINLKNNSTAASKVEDGKSYDPAIPLLIIYPKKKVHEW